MKHVESLPRVCAFWWSLLFRSFTSHQRVELIHCMQLTVDRACIASTADHLQGRGLQRMLDSSACCCGLHCRMQPTGRLWWLVVHSVVHESKCGLLAAKRNPSQKKGFPAPLAALQGACDQPLAKLHTTCSFMQYTRPHALTTSACGRVRDCSSSSSSSSSSTY